jgi:hypothetical protein
MVGDVRIAKGTEFQMTGGLNGKNENQSQWWMEWGRKSAGQRSEENELVAYF